MRPSETPGHQRTLSTIPVPDGHVLDLAQIRQLAERTEPKFDFLRIDQRGNSLFIEIAYSPFIEYPEISRFGEIIALELMTGQYRVSLAQKVILMIRQKLLKPFSTS